MMRHQIYNYSHIALCARLCNCAHFSRCSTHYCCTPLGRSVSSGSLILRSVRIDEGLTEMRHESRLLRGLQGCRGCMVLRLQQHVRLRHEHLQVSRPEEGVRRVLLHDGRARLLENCHVLSIYIVVFFNVIATIWCETVHVHLQHVHYILKSLIIWRSCLMLIFYDLTQTQITEGVRSIW